MQFFIKFVNRLHLIKENTFLTFPKNAILLISEAFFPTPQYHRTAANHLFANYFSLILFIVDKKHEKNPNEQKKIVCWVCEQANDRLLREV
jgi:hypothetical protein